MRRHHATAPRPPAPGAFARMSPALFALAATALLSACTRIGPPPDPPTAVADGETVTFPANAPQLAFIGVTAAAPRRAPLARLTGRLAWDDDCTVRIYAPVSGRVEAVETDLGRRVGAGAALARIHSPEFDQAAADLRSADANASVADKDYARARELLAQGAIAPRDLDVARAAAAAAAAERDRARARVSLYGGDPAAPGGEFILHAPLGGTVVEKNITPGQEVRPDQMLANATSLYAPLFVVSDPTRLWIQLDVPEWQLASVSPGETLRVTTPAYPARAFSGRIDNIGDELDPATLAARVRGVVANPSGLLKAGMYVLVEAVRGDPADAGPGVTVPSAAVFTVADRSFLFVEMRPGQFRRTRVEIGAEADGWIAVASGVDAGQSVVSEGALLLESLLQPAGGA